MNTNHHELTQIHSGYSALWNNLVLSVESSTCGWRASVRAAGGNQRLYTCQRVNAQAAKNAAVEFMIVGQSCPAQTANQLTWKPFW